MPRAGATASSRSRLIGETEIAAQGSKVRGVVAFRECQKFEPHLTRVQGVGRESFLSGDAAYWARHWRIGLTPVMLSCLLVLGLAEFRQSGRKGATTPLASLFDDPLSLLIS